MIARKNDKKYKVIFLFFTLSTTLLFTLGFGTTKMVYAANCYTLTLNPTGGTITVNPPPNCTIQPPDNLGYTSGTVVTLTASADTSKYEFKGWGGDAAGSNNPLNITITGNTSVIAKYSPKNDDYDFPTQIFGLSFSDTLNTTEALEAFQDDPLDPSPTQPCSDGKLLYPGHKTLWYRYTPQINEFVQVDTLGSKEIARNQDYDTYIAVWKLVQENPRVLELIDCNDDDPTSNGKVTSRLTTTLLANTTYYFQVAQYNGIVGDQSTRTIPLGGIIKFNVNITNIKVTIGNSVVGQYYIPPGDELREYYAISGGPVKVEGGGNIVSAIRLQSYANNTLYSFVETMGVPSGLLSHKYYFPTYNNTWAPLNSQLRFGNLNNTPIKVKVTIGTSSWLYDVPANAERREYLAVSGGPVIIESVDTSGNPTPDKKIIAAIRLQSYANNTLYSFSETMGIPDQLLSHQYYFPTYNNTWAPLNSQLRFGNLNNTLIRVKVTIGALSWFYDVPANTERREYLAVSGGPVIIESVDSNGNPTPDKKIIAAIRLQSYANNTLYSFVETMGVPSGLLSHKYYFPTYNNTWAPLNSQIRFGNLNNTLIRVKVTIGASSWFYDVPANTERREYLAVSGGPVIIESVDSSGNPTPDKKIIAAIRLQSYANNTLYSFSETMGIPLEQMSSTFYFPTYNNTWPPLNSQLRFGVP
jgi:uncharacterized repeat protein (TIGR02543 family)